MRSTGRLRRVSIWPRDTHILATLQLSTHNENSCLDVLPLRGRNVSDVTNLPFLTTSVTHLRSILTCCCIPYFQPSGCRTTHITHVKCSSIFFGVMTLPGARYVLHNCAGISRVVKYLKYKYLKYAFEILGKYFRILYFS